MYLIVGLGNPGNQYYNTRHNAGFAALDHLSDQYNIALTEIKHKAVYGRGIIDGQKVILAKPMTFMNLSGEAVRGLVDYYKIDVEDELIIIYDDIALPPGQLRVRKKGSAGGHNGIKNIIANLQTQDFHRVRIGVGEKPSGYDLADYVLGHFNDEEKTVMNRGYEQAADAARMIMDQGADAAMNAFNGKG